MRPRKTDAYSVFIDPFYVSSDPALAPDEVQCLREKRLTRRKKKDTLSEDAHS